MPVPEAPDILGRLKIQLDPELPYELWRPGGCSGCKGSGYVRRMGIHEFLPMDSSFHPAIVNGVDVPRLEELALERGFKTMFEDGVSKARRGLTSLEEVLRVTQ